MDDKEQPSEFEKELNKQFGSLWNRIKSFFQKMDKIELTLFTMFLICMVVGFSLFGIAGTYAIKNKDCYQTHFNLTSIEQDEVNYEIVHLTNNVFIANGIEDGKYVSYEVKENLDLYKLRELFPPGEYYLNFCPETKENNEVEYVLRGLIDGNRINKIFFGRD